MPRSALTRHRTWPRAAISFVGLVTLAAGTVLAWAMFSSIWREHRLKRSVEEGIASLTGVTDPLSVARALDRWEQRTREDWSDGPERLIERLLDEDLIADRRVRGMLTYLTGCDFGDRPEEWEQWRRTRNRLERGEQPSLPGERAVRLEKMWTAPIGRTDRASTILPIDGNIYVASLGATLGRPDDAADGVVRVRGADGESAIIFTPEGAVRDVVGLAMADDGLFVAGRDGRVYCIDPAGSLLWKGSAAAAICAPPLGLDANQDGTTDVVVLTESDRAVAFNGANGRTLWVAKLPAAQAADLAADGIRPGLAAWRLGGSKHAEIIAASPDGRLVRLEARSGRALTERRATGGFLAGPIACSPQRYGGLMCLALSRHGDGISLTADGLAGPSWLLSTGDSSRVAASLRTLTRIRGERPGPEAMFIACIGGSSRPAADGICAFDAQGVRWRFSNGGAPCGPAVIADVNGDHRSDVVVALNPTGGSADAGAILVLNADGQLVHRLAFDSPLTGSPVVADVDGDYKLELLVADQSGLLHCFKTRSSGPVEWGVAGGDAHNTQNAENAYGWAQTPDGYQRAWRP
jgi:outer membrane protein assembly factor BamB